MRWIFLSLVCLNLIVMVWFWREQAHVNELPPVNKVEQGKESSLVLLAEVNKADLRYSKAVIKDDRMNEAKRCYSAGPFKDESDAKFLAIRADALGFSSEMRSLATGSEVENWVHIPPLANRLQALQLLREIQGRGVDSYVITQGELAEGISLGLFKNAESAKKLMKRMRGMGYDVIIKEVPRGEKELWLEFPQVSQLTEPMRKRIVGDGVKLDWMLTDCSIVK